MKNLALLIVLGFIYLEQFSARLTDPQCPTPYLKSGRVRARGRGRVVRFSCYPDFELVGNKYSTCVRGAWDTAIPICVSNRCSPVPTPKHAVVGQKYQGAILMYFCEPGYLLVGNPEIYCDGRQWNGTAPYCRESNATVSLSCDFEQDDLCWWEQDPKHDFDWTKHRFDTPSAHISTGPTHDHTLGAGYNGHYLYIEASGRQVNDTARIISPLYAANLTESGCFSFWYHMYGATVGSLNVYFKPETERTPRLLWTKSGDQGNNWLRGFFDFPTVATNFQIIIEGVRGSSYVSDIAVDDVGILQGNECSFKNLTSATTAATDGDGIEVINSMQSCKNRCSVSQAESANDHEIYSNSDKCHCNLECAENNNCCPDFAEYCIYEFDQSETESSTTTTSTYSQTKVTRYTQQPTTIKNIIPTVRTSLSSSVSTPTSKTTPTTTRASTPKQVVTTKRLLTESTTRFTSTTRKSTPPRFNNPTQSEARVLPLNNGLLEKSGGLGFPEITGIALGATGTVAIAAAMVIALFRRRRSYKRNPNGSGFSEDSDVRFLTSDEALDFNLAKPTTDYEEM